MKTRVAVLVAAASLAAGLPAVAQTQSQSDSDRRDSQRSSQGNTQRDPQMQDQGSKRSDRRMSQSQSQTQPQLVRLNDLIGKNVETTRGENLGEIQNAVIDPRDERVEFVILSYQDRLIPVPWQVFHFERSRPDARNVTLNIDRERLRNAPTIQRSRLDQLADEQFSRQVYQYFGVQPMDQGGMPRDSRMNPPSRNDADGYDDRDSDRDRFNDGRDTPPREGDGGALNPYEDRYSSRQPPSSGSNAGGRSGQNPYEDRNFDQDRNSQDRDFNQDRDRMQDRDFDRDQPQARSYSMNQSIIRATDLLDTDAMTTRNEDLGQIEDVLVDANTGHVAFIVVGTGGIMGVGERLHAVPFQAVDLRRSDIVNRHELVLNIDRQQLENAPSFSENEWNTRLTDTRWTRDVYTAFGVQQPDWAYGYVPPQGGTQQGQPQRGGARMDANSVIRNWPQSSRQAAQDMIQKYGQPDSVAEDIIAWKDQGPWARIVVYRDEVRHNFPASHADVLEQAVYMRVPPDKADDLAQFDGSLIVYRTDGTIAARCQQEAMNILALNLANEIITGRRTADDARQFFQQTAQRHQQGQSSEYTQQLQFQPMSQDQAADPGSQSGPEQSPQRQGDESSSGRP